MTSKTPKLDQFIEYVAIAIVLVLAVVVVVAVSAIMVVTLPLVLLKHLVRYLAAEPAAPAASRICSIPGCGGLAGHTCHDHAPHRLRG